MAELTQLSFVEPRARATDPDTSRAAARLAALTAPTLRARCLAALQRAGSEGLTDFELADAVGSQQTSAGVRRKELVRAGFVIATDDRRPSPSGASCVVWRAVR